MRSCQTLAGYSLYHIIIKQTESVMPVMTNYDKWFTGLVYKHKKRQFMNELNTHYAIH